MTKLEAVEKALAALGEASSVDLAAFVKRKFGLEIEATFIPLFRATVKDGQRSQRMRAAARASAQAKPGKKSA